MIRGEGIQDKKLITFRFELKLEMELIKECTCDCNNLKIFVRLSLLNVN